MGKIGHGYGSEWHLLRYLGYHRELLTSEVQRLTGASELEWLDHAFSDDGDHQDAEWKGLDIITDPDIRHAWRKYWPQSGNVQNWDAVGMAEIDDDPTWILVEAKAHIAEMRSDCGAKAESSLSQIREAFRQTKEALGVDASADWEKRYYQYCNRLATLHFLESHGVPARLLFIYFVGDSFPGTQTRCPQQQSDWEEALAAQAAHIGLPADHASSDQTHELFLHVRGRPLPGRCPQCGSLKTLPISYGEPGDEGIEAAEAGKIALGGCIIAPDSPQWACGNCDHDWGSLPVWDQTT